MRQVIKIHKFWLNVCVHSGSLCHSVGIPYSPENERPNGANCSASGTTIVKLFIKVVPEEVFFQQRYCLSVLSRSTGICLAIGTSTAGYSMWDRFHAMRLAGSQTTEWGAQGNLETKWELPVELYSGLMELVLYQSVQYRSWLLLILILNQFTQYY